MTRRDIESPIQAAIYQYLRVTVPLEVGFPFAIMNGLHLSPKQRMKAVWMGMRPGMTDLALVLKKPEYGSIIWFEVKTDAKSSVLSDEQKHIRDWLDALGHRHFVVRSIDDVREVLGHLGIPTRESKL